VRCFGEIEMAGAEIQRGTQSRIAELEVLWITAGPGCDGDTIAMTAATQPSIEDILLGQIPWIPKVTLHNPFLALANGDEFMKVFHQAAEGKIENFILVIEGSIPNEHNQGGRILGLARHRSQDWPTHYHL
jgi:Ni,Fe-hydrogenase I small subunit